MKRALIAVLVFLAFLEPAPAAIDSLSRLFAPGVAVLDLDGDGLPEKPVLTIVVPDKPSPAELALASDIAARANFESLAVEFGLVRRESEVDVRKPLPCPIVIGSRVSWVQEALKSGGLEGGALRTNEGAVFLFSWRGQRGLACVGGSEEALLRTGRAFFLRWPYFWEVWGRETGATYMSLESDLARFLEAAGLPSSRWRMAVRAAHYEFPLPPPRYEGLQALSFDQGQIKELAVEIAFENEADRQKAQEALLSLGRDQLRGVRTDVLSYPACASLALELSAGGRTSRVGLTRTGATKRLLTPSFKERPEAGATGKEFDLLAVLTPKGVYGDDDRDGTPDALESMIIVPADLASPVLPDLVSRLVLATAGASFPVLQLENEVESRRALIAPILVGTNALTLDLIKTGQLRNPALKPGTGLVQVVPKAFGNSSAVVIQGADAAGLDGTLSYFARTFPHFEGFGEGRPQLSDLAADFERLLAGEKGAAEAFFLRAIEKATAEIKGRDLEEVRAELLLPRKNAAFAEAVRKTLAEASGEATVKVETSSLKDGRTVFERTKEFAWEADDALALVREKAAEIRDQAAADRPVRISVGLSESPAVRESLKERIEALLREAGATRAEVEVLSAYKPGYFWLVENVLPSLRGRGVRRLTVRFALEEEDLTAPKRTYAEPSRWLQELYPVDEILARDLGLPLEAIEFEAARRPAATYSVRAFDSRGNLVHEAAFTPRTTEVALSAVLPEWGRARATCGWLRIEAGGTVVCDVPLATDLQKFWSFYQEEILTAVVSHIRKRTGGEPTFSKQPYFKRLLVDLQASEPDFRIGLDEEIVSSLEAIHDEIYFSTLDLLRGITRFDPEDKELPPDTSRSSAPGNVFPSLHPSLEGGPTRVRAVLEDWPGQAPELVLRWKERGREEMTKKVPFPALKPKTSRLVALTVDARSGRLEDVLIETEWEKEADYLALIETLEARDRLARGGLLVDAFRFPRLAGFTVRARFPSREKDERVDVEPPEASTSATEPAPRPGEELVTTREIISPEMAKAIVGRLSAFPVVRTYVGGRSFEGRDVPVLELYLPLGPYVSLPRLIAAKPTLQIVARQHANEVASTNYSLRFVELLARDPALGSLLKKVNLVVQPMENPDGAELAYAMQREEPFHSLHAGRYGALGVDIGYQAGGKPVLPEAAVRSRLYDRWLPDVFLNLHGYPSHEWVQPFSNYTPYLFRDYWIPKGWFAYFRSVRLPVFGPAKEAGDALLRRVADAMGRDPVLAELNRTLYARYERWAARWAPHMNALEIVDGVNIYAKRRGPSETRLSPRTRLTFAEETPEVMDETAVGEWLDVLCRQGLAYIRAHVDFLAEAAHEVARIEEESRSRVRLTVLRGRPARTGEIVKPGGN